MTNTKKILIVYYSWSGKTKRIADMLRERLDADVFALETAYPYPSAQRDIEETVKKELGTGQLPELKNLPGDLSAYDLILVGGPVWWYTVATPVMRFLKETGFAGKKVAPFCTHMGGAGSYFADFRTQAVNAQVLDGIELFRVTRHLPDKTVKDIDAWLDGLETEP